MPIKRTLGILFVALALCGQAWAGPFEDGVVASVLGDYTTAIRLLRPLAEQGVADAQLELGFMYENGQGVPQDDAEAVKWYRRAAEQGLAGAQFNLGIFYERGQGVPQDYVQAHMWLNLAASRFSASEKENRDKAVAKRDAVAAKMAPAQIAEAQKLAREWKPK